jgi:hypothetical protein
MCRALRLVFSFTVLAHISDSAAAQLMPWDFRFSRINRKPQRWIFRLQNRSAATLLHANERPLALALDRQRYFASSARNVIELDCTNQPHLFQ